MQGAHIRINNIEDSFIKRHRECYETCILKIRNDRNCMAEPTETLHSWCPLTISIAFNLYILSLWRGYLLFPALCFERSILEIWPSALKCNFKLTLILLQILKKFWSIWPWICNYSLFVFQWNLLVEPCIYLDNTLYELVDVQWSNLEWREAGIIIYGCDPFLSSSCRKFLIRRRKAIMRENSPTSMATLPTCKYQNSS